MKVAPEVGVVPAVTMLIQKQVSCLPVVSGDGELHGILTSSDMMLTLQCCLQMWQSSEMAAFAVNA